MAARPSGAAHRPQQLEAIEDCRKAVPARRRGEFRKTLEFLESEAELPLTQDNTEIVYYAVCALLEKFRTAA
jgi:hypothetical protein